jgi:hypothetical protein
MVPHPRGRLLDGDQPILRLGAPARDYGLKPPRGV